MRSVPIDIGGIYPKGRINDEEENDDRQTATTGCSGRFYLMGLLPTLDTSTLSTIPSLTVR